MKLLRKPINPILFVAVFVCFQFAASNSFSQTPARNNSASIAGRVTLAGKPLADITVVATSATVFNGQSIGQGKTDHEGNYRIEGLPAGSLRVVPNAQPYVVVTAVGPYEMRGQIINLSEGEAADGVNFQLVRGGVITGRVTDTEGTPVIGEQIAVTAAKGRDEMWYLEGARYRTDDRGIYRIFGLEAGSYVVSVGQDNPSAAGSMGRFGSVFSKTYYPGTPNRTQAKVLELKEGEELSNIDLVAGNLPRGFAVSGRVLDIAGKPVSNVTVGYSALEGVKPAVTTINVINPPTDADGKFRVEGMQPGKYGAFTLGGAAQPGSVYSELSRFEVIDADVTGVIIKVSPGATISGVAVVENNSDPAVLSALQSIRLVAQSQDPERPAAPSLATSNILADGSFTLAGLSPGKVRIGTQNYPEPPKGFSLARVEIEGVVHQTIEVADGADIKNVRLVFSYGAGSLRGRLKIEGGTLPEGARLYAALVRSGDGMQPFRRYIAIDARGHFFADNLPAGTYEMKTQIVDGRDNSRRIDPVTRHVTIAHDVETDVTVVLNLTPGERP
jgi:protocatechuate 3,4-dioxygenase beta subunit